MTCCYCILAGLWSGLIIGVVTEYYASHTYRPTREISESQEVSAATGIIFGLALGYKSCIVPTFCLAFTICLSHICAGMYGIALAALGMLGTLVWLALFGAYTVRADVAVVDVLNPWTFTGLLYGAMAVLVLGHDHEVRRHRRERHGARVQPPVPDDHAGRVAGVRPLRGHLDAG